MLRALIGKSFEGNWGAPLPTFDRQTAEQNDTEIGRAAKKDSDGAAEENAGGEYDQTSPFGEPDQFERAGAFEKDGGVWRGRDVAKLTKWWAYGRKRSGGTKLARVAKWSGRRCTLIAKRMRALTKDDPGPQVLFQQIPVVIDRPKGYVQNGTDPQGVAWSREYLVDYGYIPNTNGGDDEGLDVYLGPDASSDLAIWIVQITPSDPPMFDEYKLMLGFSTPQEAIDMYLAHTPEKFLGAVGAMPVAAIRALLGLDPTTLVKRDQLSEATMSTQIKKDDQPAGPGTQPNGDETPAIGGGGGDIVSIAADRLQSIVDSIDAAGGLTPDLRGEIAPVVALLEAVGGEDDDFDDEESGTDPMGPGDPAPMVAAEKRNTRVDRIGKKLVVRMAKRSCSPDGYIAKTMQLMRRAAVTKNEALRKVRFLAVEKMLTFGPELFPESAFASPNTDVPEIPMYEEAMVDQHVTDEGVPPEEAVKSGFAYDPKYTPNANSQSAYNTGSPNFEDVSKRLSTVREKLAAMKKGADTVFTPGAPAQPQKAADSQEGKPVPAEECTKTEDVKSAETSELQKAERGDDGWPDDLATPEFLKGEKLAKSMPFGWDNLPAKAKAIADAEAAQPSK